MEIRYSWGTGAADGQPREMSVPDFDTFEKTIRDNRTTIGVLPEDTKDELDAKKCRLPYIWHAFKTGAARRRRSASAGDLYYLPLDLDGVTKNGWECIREILSAYRGFAYTTASHEHPVAKGEYRIRIVLAPSRAVSPSEKQPLLQTIQSEIMSVVDLFYDGPAKWDDSVYRPAQMVFLPDERAQFWSFGGDEVDVDTLLANALVPIETPDDTEHDDLTRLVDLENIDGTTFGDLRSALWHPGMLQHAENYPTWAAMGNRLAWFKDTDHEEKVKALWIEWSTKAIKGDPEAAANKWEQLTADRTGYQSIFSLAQKAGWTNPGAERFQSAVACVDDFEDVTADDSGEVSEYLPLPPFSRDKNGQPEGNITNILMALRHPDLCGVQIRLDEFRNEIILTTPQGKLVQLRDEYYTKLHEKLESDLQFKKFQEADIKRAIRLVAYENRYDSLKEWVNALPEWDGTPRIDTFFCRHWGIYVSAYTKAVGRYWWTLLAGRALVPGIKGDMAVVLASEQGKNKSEGIRAMAPTPEHYMELDFEKPVSERVREMRGHNIIELGEMRGMNKAGVAAVRVTISTRADRNRGLYREHYDELPRRCGFIATTNSDKPLTDTEGNRRWLPMTIPDEIDGKFIAQGIADERDQLWAEAVAVFKAEGIAWENAETLAKSVLGDYEARDDVWFSCIAEWLEASSTELLELTDVSDSKNYERVPLTSKDLLVEAVGFKASQVKRGDEMKIAKIMKDLGYKKRQLQSIPGKPYHWEKRD
ncbi:VapE domain-containing protein [Xenorhabdus bovienii]|uniref:VapE domain-containing protein n=1 Tax=Xenorhabdus bovienii TaxID=40576 RepID=UPI0023B29A90|nr:VapE domain-containing protein [Xenorhabdus bovienii]